MDVNNAPQDSTMNSSIEMISQASDLERLNPTYFKTAESAEYKASLIFHGGLL